MRRSTVREYNFKHSYDFIDSTTHTGKRYVKRASHRRGRNYFKKMDRTTISEVA